MIIERMIDQNPLQSTLFYGLEVSRPTRVSFFAKDLQPFHSDIIKRVTIPCHKKRRRRQLYSDVFKKPHPSLAPSLQIRHTLGIKTISWLLAGSRGRLPPSLLTSPARWKPHPIRDEQLTCMLKPPIHTLTAKTISLH